VHSRDSRLIPSVGEMDIGFLIGMDREGSQKKEYEFGVPGLRTVQLTVPGVFIKVGGI
jgi:hypothetical protein